MLIIKLMYIGPLKTVFTKCFGNQAEVGNSGRRYYGINTTVKPNTRKPSLR